MRKILGGALGMSLGFLSATALADDSPWQTAGAPRLGKPVPSRLAPPSKLDRSVLEGEIQPAAFRPALVDAAPAVFRAQNPEAAPQAQPPQELLKRMPTPLDGGTGAAPAQPVPASAAPAAVPMAPAAPAGPVVVGGPAMGSNDCGGNTCTYWGTGGPFLFNGCGWGWKGWCKDTASWCQKNWLWDKEWKQYHPFFSYNGDPYHFYARGEYLQWWIKDGNTPPLVTTSIPGSLGVIGAPTTTVLYGGNDAFSFDSFSGGRFTLGWWFDPCHDCGIEGSYFFLGQQTEVFEGASAGVPLLARPFFNPLILSEDSQLVAAPGVLSGGVRVETNSRLQGAELNLMTTCCRGCCFDWEWLAGFRFLSLDEGLQVQENLIDLGTGTNIQVADVFGTHNRFYGGQIGTRYEQRWGRWFVNLSGKVGLGATYQVVNINGNTVFTPPGGAAVNQPGGLLALPTNSGRHARDQFSVVPELGVTLGYNVNDQLRLFVGYNLLYWSNVARPGNQIDRVINPTQLPTPAGPGVLVGPARPQFKFNDTDFWAQGMTFGLEYRY